MNENQEINLPPLPAAHPVHSIPANAKVYTPARMLDYARAAVLADRAARANSQTGTNPGPVAFRSAHSISSSFNRGEHENRERAINIVERSGLSVDLYRVDLGVLGEIYVKPEVASDRFQQLKRDQAPVKAVYPMYQGTALPNATAAIRSCQAWEP